MARPLVAFAGTVELAPRGPQSENPVQNLPLSALHPQWPSFNTPQGQAMRYSAEYCPFTVDIFARAANIAIGPRYSEGDLKDIVTGIKKVYRDGGVARPIGPGRVYARLQTN